MGHVVTGKKRHGTPYDDADQPGPSKNSPPIPDELLDDCMQKNPQKDRREAEKKIPDLATLHTRNEQRRPRCMTPATYAWAVERLEKRLKDYGHQRIVGAGTIISFQCAPTPGWRQSEGPCHEAHERGNVEATKIFIRMFDHATMRSGNVNSRPKYIEDDPA
ncbi:hypothetical protein BDV12DRAFT_195864 [Aspergillus spectabilis]